MKVSKVLLIISLIWILFACTDNSIYGHWYHRFSNNDYEKVEYILDINRDGSIKFRVKFDAGEASIAGEWIRSEINDKSIVVRYNPATIYVSVKSTKLYNELTEDIKCFADENHTYTLSQNGRTLIDADGDEYER